MATEKLYYEDSHLRHFSAVVQSCTPGKHGWDVILDRTAFYPEGGGQPGDRGRLGGVSVTDTHEMGGDIVHYCDGPLEPGTTVLGDLDWPWRFQLMQQHSGEHLVSGFVHQLYGYDNVGFHMGKDAVTIDFDGFLSEAQLEEIEAMVNHAIWMNIPFQVLYPTPEELPKIPYRSKKALTGQVRIVRVPGVDLCACCGTHVSSTGEIGLVKFLNSQKFHEGVRIDMLSGGRAMDYLTASFKQNKQISGLLSAKPHETAAAAAKLQQDLNDTKFHLGRLEDQLFRQKAESLRGRGDVLLFEEGLKPDSLRRLTDAITQTCGGRCAVFSPTEDGFHYAIGQAGGDLRTFTKALNGALNGRGGGKPFFVQGSVHSTKEAITAFIKEQKAGMEP